tara:strand:- start:236 stop:691 length:456 start_codon:yes stop_codon:yes gene_type:complete
MVKKTIIVFLLILLFGCKAKIVTVETHSTDTIYKSEIIKITPSQLNQLIIDSPCDSLGKLKPINYTFVSNNVKGTLKSDLNTLKLEVNVDSIVSSRINEYKSSLKTTEKTIEIPVVPAWINKMLITSLLINLFFIIFVFRKKIPLLKWLPF